MINVKVISEWSSLLLAGLAVLSSLVLYTCYSFELFMVLAFLNILVCFIVKDDVEIKVVYTIGYMAAAVALLGLELHGI